MAYEFYLDMINKTTSRCHKQAPNKIIVFNYVNKNIYEMHVMLYLISFRIYPI